MNLFSEFNLSPSILKAITELGYTQPTEIQQQAIPFIFSNSQDLIALAATGTGKTAAFSLPILNLLDTHKRKIQLVVLCPTRELCIQITNEIKNYSKHLPHIKSVAVYGGSSIREQIQSIREKPQIIVGTPGRVIDLLERKSLDFSEISWLVLDEADEMLSMGFKEDLETILSKTPPEKRTFLFSATMNKDIERITKNYLTHPHKISVSSHINLRKNIAYEFYVVHYRQKKEALKRLIDANPNQYSIIFCRTKVETQDVADYLMQHGYAADSLHGDLSQAQRDTVMKKFRLKNIDILVATDVAARGLDVNSLTHVMHYSLPDESEVFVHRSGRTGRAGKQGISIALVKPDEIRKIKQIIRETKIDIVEKHIPTGNEIVKAQVAGVFENLFTEHKDYFDFNDAIIPDLSGFTKIELVHKLLQFHLRELALYYKEKDDIENLKHNRGENKFEKNNNQFSRGKYYEEDNGRRKTKPENMVKFFLSVGKRDQLKKADVLEVINFACQKIKQRPDVGKIEILEKHSFFEIDKNYKIEILKNISTVKFKGRSLRAEISK